MFEKDNMAPPPPWPKFAFALFFLNLNESFFYLKFVDIMVYYFYLPNFICL